MGDAGAGRRPGCTLPTPAPVRASAPFRPPPLPIFLNRGAARRAGACPKRRGAAGQQQRQAGPRAATVIEPDPAPRRMQHGGPALAATLEAARSGAYEVDVFGLGYVGLPLAVRLAGRGVRVTGIDTGRARLERLRGGSLMSSEAHLAGEFGRAVSSGRLRLSDAPLPRAAGMPRIGIICVPTPAPGGAEPSSGRVMAAAGSFLDGAAAGDVIVIESSVGSGTTDEVRAAAAARGRPVGPDLGLCFCPERVDPANKRWSLENIPRVVYCSDDLAYGIATEVYRSVNSASLFRVSSAAAAEVVKSYENAFRLVNISLVNELAVLCDALGIDSREVIAAASTKPFGFMPFAPGAGAGGHCIPKDPRFLADAAARRGLAFASIDGALATNAAMPEYVCGRIHDRLSRMGLAPSAMVCGLAYKADVEDMRDSAGFRIVAGLAARGFAVRTYDPHYDGSLLPKYLKENGLDSAERRPAFEAAAEISAETLRGVSCLWRGAASRGGAAAGRRGVRRRAGARRVRLPEQARAACRVPHRPRQARRGGWGGGGGGCWPRVGRGEDKEALASRRRRRPLHGGLERRVAAGEREHSLPGGGGAVKSGGPRAAAPGAFPSMCQGGAPARLCRDGRADPSLQASTSRGRYAQVWRLRPSRPGKALLRVGSGARQPARPAAAAAPRQGPFAGWQCGHGRRHSNRRKFRALKYTLQMPVGV